MMRKNIPKTLGFDYNEVMIWLRRGFVWFLSIILLVSLVAGVAALDINSNLGNPSGLKSWLANSKIYDHVTAAALQQAEKSGSSNGDAGSISLSDPLVRQAAETIFSPSLVQNSVNSIIDSNYAWLAGKKAIPDFKIDLTSAKQDFAKQVGQAAQSHLAALPVCNPVQLSQLSIPVDLLSINCRPATLDPKAEGIRVAQETNSSSDFVKNSVITADTVNQDQFGQDSSSNDASQGQPYYKKLSWAPKAYQIGSKLPWIFGGVALLSILGIVFIAPSRRRGARRIGVVLVLAGLVLIGLKLVADATVSSFAKVSIKGGLASELKQPVSDFMHQVEPHLVRDYLLFGIVFLVVATAIFIMLFKSRGGNDKRPRISRVNPADKPVDSPKDASNIRLAPRRNSPTSAPELPALRPNPPASKPAPLGKNPPRPKKPRLIQ